MANITRIKASDTRKRHDLDDAAEAEAGDGQAGAAECDGLHGISSCFAACLTTVYHFLPVSSAFLVDSPRPDAIG